MGEVKARIPFSIRVSLKEDSSRGMFRSISSYGKGFGKEALFQVIKGVLTRLKPEPGFVFLGEVDEWSSNVGIVSNEFLIEVGKS